ncbi:hypothetical protein QN372_18200 [Undibacterium sp. RTI2.1]|uniref:hypothetical protein n=1 Tax=unclassified Undibacterium TaxID=2630295 RepID=UPI002B2334B4|nr:MULTISPECIES: hypothetical protein [unclassified Undibacterium]MEB0032684.1 hypothetical protein [Undibacterium sp. RTI2.1]MEB0118675.1 hypothetical protein [Undibacterium sp. RTI2.2]
MEWFVLIAVLVVAGVIYWFADDYIHRPMSYWSKEQLDAAFKRNPQELAKFINRDSMSRWEWIAAINKRNAETDAELARRGIK